MTPPACEIGGPSGAAARFATTHWSVVLDAGKDSSPAAAEALDRLCRTYWFPLYAYVRREGHSPEDAQDLTQEFFAHFLERKLWHRADRKRGHFRSFLLTSMQHFLAHEWERARAEKRGGGRIFVSWDEEAAEERYQLDVNPELAPDRLFDRRCALALFQNALQRLQKESAAGGKSAQFEELKGFLSSQPAEGAYAGPASRLGLSTGAVAVAVHRLRQRYGELVREEIAHTVATVSELEGEMRYLVKLISA